MIKRILVPIDGSKTATKALKYAVDLAEQTGASITILNVIDSRLHIAQWLPASSGSPLPIPELLEDYLKQAAQEYTESSAKLCKAKEVKSKQAVRYGHPIEEILKEAEKSKTDLIVIGSHGKSALKASFLGSITYGLIHRDTKYPVLVVRK